ncbi:MAG: hypothetical protein SV429_13055 [Pseudomonadota bacterium]|nr:hypothetical protein [Pseudomonadota bacterium]
MTTPDLTTHQRKTTGRRQQRGHSMATRDLTNHQQYTPALFIQLRCTPRHIALLKVFLATAQSSRQQTMTRQRPPSAN